MIPPRAALSQPALDKILIRLLLLFLLAFTVRMAFCRVMVKDFQAPPPQNDDGVEYDKLAKSLVHRLSYQYAAGFPATAFRTPLYPFYLAGIYSLFGENYSLVRFSQFVVSAVSCCLLWYLAYISTGRNQRIAWIAGGLAAINPSLFTHSSFLLTEAILPFFVLLACVTLAWVQEQPRWWRQVLCGLALGLLCLLRPNFTLFAGLLLLWAGVMFSGWKKIQVYAAIMLMLLLTLSPWIIRNYLQFHRVIITTTNGGMNFWGSNNPNILKADLEKYGAWKGGTFYNLNYLPGTEQLNVNWKSKDYDQFAIEQISWKLGIAYLQSNPQDIPRLLANKFVRLWSGDSKKWNKFIRAWSGSSWQWRLAEWGFWILDQGMIPFALFGFILSLYYLRPPHYLLILVLSVQISALIFFAAIRMRVGLAPALLIYAAIALDQLGQWLAKPAGRVIVGGSKLPWKKS